MTGVVAKILWWFLERSLNWSRGFFRLWVLFAVLWTVGGAAIGAHTLYRLDCWWQCGKAVVTPQPEGPWTNFQKPENVYFDVQRGGARYQVEAPAGTSAETIRAAIEKYGVFSNFNHQVEMAGLILLGIIAPPAVLLIIGLALRWALLGFKP